MRYEKQNTFTERKVSERTDRCAVQDCTDLTPIGVQNGQDTFGNIVLLTSSLLSSCFARMAEESP